MVATQLSYSKIEAIARLVRSMDRRDKAQLLHFVPELRTISLAEANEDPRNYVINENEVVQYFQQKFQTSQSQPIERNNQLFLAGLTVDEFLSLSESEQEHIWNEAYRAVEKNMKYQEYPVHANALPAR